MKKQYIFTIIFGLLLVSGYAKPPKTTYFAGKWDGNAVQINNPQVVNKNAYCITQITINGKKVKTIYKIGGIEFDPASYGFEPQSQLLIAIKHRHDCEPTFNSSGFKVQRD
jgi:hypothetical protein